MIQKGVLYTIKNDANGNEERAPLKNIFIYFSQEGKRVLTTMTDEEGRFSFDISNGSYQVFYSRGAGAAVHILGGGASFEVTDKSSDGSFEDWIMAPSFLKPEENPLFVKLLGLSEAARISAASAESSAEYAKNAEENIVPIIQSSIEEAVALADVDGKLKDAVNKATSESEGHANDAKRYSEEAGKKIAQSIDDALSAADIDNKLLEATSKATARSEDAAKRSESAAADVGQKIADGINDALIIADIDNKLLEATSKAVSDASSQSESAASQAREAAKRAENAADNTEKTIADGINSAIEKADIDGAIEKIVEERAPAIIKASDILIKTEKMGTIFIKKSHSSVSIKKGTSIYVENKWLSIEKDLAISMPSMTPGSDYIVVINSKGVASALKDDFNLPASTPKGSVVIGGFHFGLIGVNETVSSGGFSVSGSGFLWGQSDVDKIKGVNEYSFWDLRFRAGGIVNIPGSPRDGQLSNHGMVYDPASNIFTSIYHINNDIDKNGISKAGAPIASGTVLPVMPKWFGGDGAKKYDNLNWWTANELAMAHGARLMTESEFNSRAFGVTEGKSAGGGSTTYPRAEFIAGLTSKIGCIQASGTQWYWGADASYRYDGSGWAWENVTGGRGNLYIQGKNGTVRALFGGHRTNGADAGSRCVHWLSDPWRSDWNIGAVAVRDLLVL